MAYSKILDDDGNRRLSQVIATSGGDLNRVPEAVHRALRGVAERGRWIYLKNQLTRLAKRYIRDQGQRASRAQKSSEQPRFIVTPALRLDAWRHEQELLNGIPEEDR